MTRMHEGSAVAKQKVFGIAGWSGTGKTTMVEALIPVLISRGVLVSTVKHAHHHFDIDKPGKDSFRHREAGAMEVMIASAQRWVLMHEIRNQQEPDLSYLLNRMTPVDLILVEGFKHDKIDKIELHRPSLGKPLLYPNDPRIRALASDQPIPDLTLPCLDLNDIGAVASFIIGHCELESVAA